MTGSVLLLLFSGSLFATDIESGLIQHQGTVSLTDFSCINTLGFPKYIQVKVILPLHIIDRLKKDLRIYGRCFSFSWFDNLSINEIQLQLPLELFKNKKPNEFIECNVSDHVRCKLTLDETFSDNALEKLYDRDVNRLGCSVQ